MNNPQEDEVLRFFSNIQPRKEDKGAFWMRLSGGAGVKEFIQADFAKWVCKKDKGAGQ